MRKCLIFFSLLFIFSCSENDELEVVSLNIRYDNPRDGINAWPGRKELLVDFLDSAGADIFGLQEVLYHQYSYIDSVLSDYVSVAAGRDDGLQSGEMSPVFYLSDRFELMDQSTFWLSETPDIPGSRGWGAVLPRIVTWVRLHDRQAGEELYCFNTHFSHMSDSARLMSAGILAEEVSKIAGPANFIITGDFNMSPDSKAYKALLMNQVSEIADSYESSDRAPVGPNGTFNGFSKNTRPGRIDYIFVKEGIRVISHETLEIRKDSVFISDHWPLLVKLDLE